MTAAPSDPSFARIAAILERRTGLSFAPGREAVVEAGIRRAMQRAGILDPRRYLEVLEASSDPGPGAPGERAPGQAPLDDLADELTVGETYFFRHPEQIEILRTRILPELLRARSPGHFFRVWSAGCASGEEAYTLAIVLDDLGLGERSHILATDISRAALSRARRASYTSWSLRGVPEHMRRAWFTEEGKRLTLLPRYRKRVAFEHCNLALDTYPSLASGIWGLDLVFCRNVIIYFSRETIREVARRLHASLAPGGFLVMGASDAPLWDLAPFETIRTPAGIVYRRGDDRPAARPVSAAPEPPPPPRPAPRDDRPSPPHAETGLAAPSAPAAPPGARDLADAFSSGDFARAAALAGQLAHDPAACVIGVRAVAASRGAEAAEQACAEASARHPLSVELCLLRTLMLLELGRLDEATEAARRALYLDHRSPMAHFTAATVARRRDDLEAARRGYRNARKLAAALPPDAIVPMTEGERAARMAEAAAVQLALIGSGD